MTKVFITQEQSKLNYLPAEKYGEIQFITRDEFSPVAGSLANVRLMDQIVRHMKTFDPMQDYIVFSGSPTIAAAVFAIVGRLQIDAFRILRWSNRDNSYTPILIHIATKE
jgi:hypothetical protein